VVADITRTVRGDFVQIDEFAGVATELRNMFQYLLSASDVPENLAHCPTSKDKMEYASLMNQHGLVHSNSTPVFV
jgi:hypothetical protein